jgi:hypothetical protein
MSHRRRASPDFKRLFLKQLYNKSIQQSQYIKTSEPKLN